MWDYIVFGCWLLGAIAAFTWRKSREKIFYYVWLGLSWVEIELRKERDKKIPKDKRGI